MTRLLPAAGILSCFLAPLAAQEPITVKGTVKVADFSNREAMPPIAPISESAQLAPATATTPTFAACVEPMAGTWTIKGKQVAIVVGKSKADVATPDLLAIDLDGDGKLDQKEQMPLAVTEQKARNQTMLVGKAIDCTFHLGGAELPAKVGYMARGDSASINVQFPSYLEAKVKVGETEQTIAVVDKDQDGKFGTAGDQWALQPNGAKQPVSAFGLSAIGERRFLTDTLVGIAVHGDDIKVTMTAAKGPDAHDAEAQRARVEKTWKERFDKDRAEFYAAKKMDESRPLATTPVHWNYVSFEEGLAMAKKANKPLFVDVMAFWCVWCYRMDYTTYPDKEVADLLNNSFVPVKIIQEQDLVDDYSAMMKKLEARGIPAMGIFDADGKKLHSIGGWKKPDEFVTELKTALTAAGGK